MWCCPRIYIKRRNDLVPIVPLTYHRRTYRPSKAKRTSIRQYPVQYDRKKRLSLQYAIAGELRGFIRAVCISAFYKFQRVNSWHETPQPFSYRATQYTGSVIPLHYIQATVCWLLLKNQLLSFSYDTYSKGTTFPIQKAKNQNDIFVCVV